jgi:hypothetical protein
MLGATAQWAQDVRTGVVPGPEQTFH